MDIHKQRGLYAMDKECHEIQFVAPCALRRVIPSPYKQGKEYNLKFICPISHWYFMRILECF